MDNNSRWYAFLSTPYTADRDRNERLAAQLSGLLYGCRVPHFSPVVQGHRATRLYTINLSHLEYDDWLQAHMPMLRGSSLVIRGMLPGHAESFGMGYEQRAAVRLGIPVLEWHPPYTSVPSEILDAARGAP